MSPASRCANRRRDVSLNNAVNFFNEDSGVLKTDTGTWIFVKPQVADFYFNMLRIRGSGDQQLPVYGYVLEDEKALPRPESHPDNLPLPAMDEVGFFRPAPATSAGRRFGESLVHYFSRIP